MPPLPMSSRISSCGNSGGQFGDRRRIKRSGWSAGDGVLRRALFQQAGGAESGERADGQRRAALRTFRGVCRGRIHFGFIHTPNPEANHDGCYRVFRNREPRPEFIASTSIPDAEWDGVQLQKNPASRAFVRLFPDADAMQGRDRTGRLEFLPLARTARRQPVQHRGKFRGDLGRISLEPRRGFESDHRVVERLAVNASDGLDGEMFAFSRAARDVSAITAPGTFEQISPAHKVRFRCRQNYRKEAPGRTFFCAGLAAVS